MKAIELDLEEMVGKDLLVDVPDILADLKEIFGNPGAWRHLNGASGEYEMPAQVALTYPNGMSHMRLTFSSSMLYCMYGALKNRTKAAFELGIWKTFNSQRGLDILHLTFKSEEGVVVFELYVHRDRRSGLRFNGSEPKYVPATLAEFMSPAYSANVCNYLHDKQKVVTIDEDAKVKVVLCMHGFAVAGHADGSILEMLETEQDVLEAVKKLTPTATCADVLEILLRGVKALEEE